MGGLFARRDPDASLPLLAASTTPVELNWHELQFQKAEESFRFLVPAGPPLHLVWFCGLADGSDKVQWYIRGRRVEAAGFESFDVLETPQVVNGRRIEKGFLQDHAPLAPGQEYVIWFRFPTPKVRTVYVSLHLSPRPDFAALGLEVNLA